MSNPTPLGELLSGVLSRLGMRDLAAWSRLRDEWLEVAGPPWDRHSRPLALSEGRLVVEATTPAAVGVLRYGVAGLRSRLVERYGPGVVDEIEVRAPTRRRV